MTPKRDGKRHLFFCAQIFEKIFPKVYRNVPLHPLAELRVEGGFKVEKTEAVLEQVEALAQSRVNDAIRLAFLTSEDLAVLDKLDLSSITEFKRNRDGGVEMKFVDRLSAFQWLLAQRQAAPQRDGLQRAIATGGGEVWGEEK